MKAIDKLREISKTLASRGIETAEKEAVILVRELLAIDTAVLYRDDPEINDKQMASIDNAVSRRGKREPLQYILGYCDFSGFKILTGRGTLIPRPETELMAEHAIKKVRSQKSNDGQRTTVLDLCTGSGCLALALAGEFPEARVYGTDISETAVTYARKSADINKIKNASFFTGHLFEPLDHETTGLSFDLIISNPPYIRTDDIQTLQPEVRDWEPVKALDGGRDGLDFYREIIPAAQQLLKDNGILMLELCDGCAKKVHKMLKDAGYTEIELQKDYAQIERIIQAKWTK
jgi:release factor glutamine methyltransferase